MIQFLELSSVLWVWIPHLRLFRWAVKLLSSCPISYFCSPRNFSFWPPLLPSTKFIHMCSCAFTHTCSHIPSGLAVTKKVYPSASQHLVLPPTLAHENIHHIINEFSWLYFTLDQIHTWAEWTLRLWTLLSSAPSYDRWLSWLMDLP